MAPPYIFIQSIKLNGIKVECDRDPISVDIRPQNILVDAIIVYPGKVRFESTFTFPIRTNDEGFEVSFANAEKKIREFLK